MTQLVDEFSNVFNVEFVHKVSKGRNGLSMDQCSFFMFYYGRRTNYSYTSTYLIIEKFAVMD